MTCDCFTSVCPLYCPDATAQRVFQSKPACSSCFRTRGTAMRPSAPCVVYEIGDQRWGQITFHMTVGSSCTRINSKEDWMQICRGTCIPSSKRRWVNCASTIETAAAMYEASRWSSTLLPVSWIHSLLREIRANYYWILNVLTVWQATLMCLMNSKLIHSTCSYHFVVEIL